jgi:hypothetical protein
MGDRRKCRTYTASPAEPGGLPVMLDATDSQTKHPQNDRTRNNSTESDSEARRFNRFWGTRPLMIPSCSPHILGGGR